MSYDINYIAVTINQFFKNIYLYIIIMFIKKRKELKNINDLISYI